MIEEQYGADHKDCEECASEREHDEEDTRCKSCGRDHAEGRAIDCPEPLTA
jgi:hypothetical protein